MWFGLGSAGGGEDFDTNFAVPVGVWAHYAVTVDSAGVVVVYVNGAAVMSAAGTVGPPPPATRSHLYLGRSWFTGDPLLPGALSDLQFALGAVLTPRDVRSMAQGRGCPAAPPPRLHPDLRTGSRERLRCEAGSKL